MLAELLVGVILASGQPVCLFFREGETLWPFAGRASREEKTRQVVEAEVDLEQKRIEAPEETEVDRVSLLGPLSKSARQ